MKSNKELLFMASQPQVIELLLLIPLILTVSIKNPKKKNLYIISLTSLTHSPLHNVSLTHYPLHLHNTSRPSLQPLQKLSNKPICSHIFLYPSIPHSPSSSAIRTHLLSPSLVLTISTTDP